MPKKLEDLTLEELREAHRKAEDRKHRAIEHEDMINNLMWRKSIEECERVSEVQILDHSESGGWQKLGGDAGKSESDWFKVRIQTLGLCEKVAIMCPEFVRNTLTLYIRAINGELEISGSY